MLAYASIWPRMSFAHASPIMYPPLDCSADSAMTSHRPKCSAGTTPRISYRENARLLPQFFALAERAVMPVYCLSFSCSPSVYRRKAEPWQAEPQQSQVTAKTSHAKSNRRKTIRSDIYNGGTPGKAAADPGVLLLLGDEALEYHSAATA